MLTDHMLGCNTELPTVYELPEEELLQGRDGDELVNEISSLYNGIEVDNEREHMMDKDD